MAKKVSFGSFIAETRKSKNQSQKELAAQINISPQYLNDIEHDKRSPSSPQLIQQITAALQIDSEYLSYLAGRISEEVKDQKLDQATFKKAMLAFRKAVEK
jgi:transcriptional regulator with XRE-family HTH domain